MGIYKTIKKATKSVGKSIKDYQEKAPERREAYIEKLKQQRETSKLKAETRGYEKKHRPKPAPGFGGRAAFNPFGAMGADPLFGGQAQQPRRKAKKKVRKVSKPKARKPKRVIYQY